jgi:hypothetical protein
MKRTALMTSALALLTMPAFADGHAGTMGYILSADGTSLMVMNSIAAPADVTTFTLSAPLRSIAWRPVTGELVGYADGSIVTIDSKRYGVPLCGEA